MKLKLIIRFQQMALQTLELEPGEYDVGRSSESHIFINHPSVHRRQGRVFSSEQGWVYEDHQRKITHSFADGPAELSADIDLAPEQFTQEEVTQDTLKVLMAFRRDQRKRMLFGGLVAAGFVLGSLLTYFFVSRQQGPSDPNQLLSQVRSKIVEFEKIRDEEALQDYEKLGQFKADDFRDRYGFCTGFLVAPNVILTASHCLWGSDFLDLQTNFEIRAADDKTYKPKRVLGFDPIRDYLFLEVEGMEGYGYLDMNPNLRVGQRVYTLGNAHGQGIAIREGIMASETPDVNDPSIRFIRYSAGASPGNSGGPLLDAQGRVVALVFAATGAENYNLGTSAKDLKVGFEAFVKSQKAQAVSVQLRRLFNFNPMGFLQKQSLPYLPDYNEYPELIQKINDVQLSFEVPIPMEKLSEEILSEVQEKSMAAVKSIEEDLRSKNELVLDWGSFVTDKTPLIHASQFDLSQNNFFLWQKRYYMKLAGFLDSPGKKEFKTYIEQFNKEKKFDFQAYGMNSEIVPPSKPDDPIYYFSKSQSKGKKGIEDLVQGPVYSQFWLNKTVNDSTLLKDFLEKYVDEEGVIASTYSAFIRPQSFKNFTISSIPKTSEKTLVKDGSGREWHRFAIKIFDQLNIFVYCLPLPEGTACVARMIPVENEYRLSLLEGNFREHFLSHFLENPYFWSPGSLEAFLQQSTAQTLSSFKGVDFKKSSNGYWMTLQGYKIQFQLPENMQSVRLQTGLFKASNGKGQWTGLGADWVQVKGSNVEVCGTGVEVLGSQSVFILNFLRDSLKRLKLKEDVKPEDIPKLWTEKIKDSQGRELQLYGYCAPLRENPLEIGYYFVDFKKAKPYRSTFKVL